MNKYLRIQGKVLPIVLQTLGIGLAIGTTDKGWFFVDYANTEFKKRTLFDVRLSEAADKIQEYSEIRLIKITDQFGHNLECIPIGYKTICQLQFLNGIPTYFNRLPLLSQWETRKRIAVIANTKDLTLDKYEGKIKDLLEINIQYIKWALQNARKENRQSKDDIIEIISKQLNIKEDFARRNIDTLIEFGVLKSKEGLLVDA